MVTLTAAASCQCCDWAAAGDPETVDKASEKHTRTAGHATAVTARPVTP